MSSNLTMITVLVSVIHVVALTVMIWIRVRRTEGDGIPVPSPKITPCARCGEPATDWSYDGLDPDEQRDSYTGKLWSADMAHYQPVCAAHLDFSVPYGTWVLSRAGNDPGEGRPAGDGRPCGKAPLPCPAPPRSTASHQGHWAPARRPPPGGLRGDGCGNQRPMTRSLPQPSCPHAVTVAE